MESLGHNKRDNHISILGMSLFHKYVLNRNDNSKKIQLFINNKYIGLYSIEGKKERSMINIDKEIR